MGIEWCKSVYSIYFRFLIHKSLQKKMSDYTVILNHFLSRCYKCKMYKESDCIVKMIVGLLCKEEAACCPRGPGR